MRIILHPKKDCKLGCRGTGAIYNRVPVPFGIGTCNEELCCDCLFEDLDDLTFDRINNGEEFTVEENNSQDKEIEQ